MRSCSWSPFTSFMASTMAFFPVWGLDEWVPLPLTSSSSIIRPLQPAEMVGAPSYIVGSRTMHPSVV